MIENNKNKKINKIVLTSFDYKGTFLEPFTEKLTYNNIYNKYLV